MAKPATKSTGAKADTTHRGDNAATEARDAEGRFAKAKTRKLPSVKMPKVKVPEITTRNAAIGAIGAGVAVAVVAAGAALLRGRSDKPAASASDTMAESEDAQTSAEAAKFVTAGDVIDDDKRAAFAPATKPVPSRVEAMGNGDDA